MNYSIDKLGVNRGGDSEHLIESRHIVQNCYVVRDLEAACRRLHEIYRIGPFLGGGLSELGNHTYRGAPAPPISLRSVFAQSGHLVVELVELHSAAPSAFHDMYPDGGEGFHHSAILMPDYVSERDRLVLLGFPIASEFQLSFGPSVCYVDARPSLGHMIEICPEHEIILDRYRQAREATHRWDRVELILPWRSLRHHPRT